MDSSEVRTLRHKRHLLVTSIIINDDVIQHLLRMKLMTARMVTSMQSDPSNMLKMARYLDTLEGSVGLGKNVFSRFCEFLLDRFPRIHDELTVELEAVRGELHIEEYVREEAHVLVQREFNDIKRLKDFEKQEIEDLVATRIQVHKNIWNRTIGIARGHQEKERLDVSSRNGFLKDMGSRFDRFIRINDKDGVYAAASEKQKQATEQQTVGDVEKSKGPLGKMKQLVKDIETLKELSLRNMAARNDALQEKSRVLRMIGVSTTPARLDKEVEAILESLELEEKDAEAELMLRQQKTEELQAKLKEIDETRREDEEEIDERIQTQKDLFETTHHVAQTDRNQMYLLQRQLARVTDHLSRIRSKSTMLFRGRSMGYATNDVLERVKVLRSFTASRSELSKTPRRVTFSRSLDRRPLLSHRSTT